MKVNIDVEAEFQKFRKVSEELDQMAKEIDSDYKALDEALNETDEIKLLEKRLKENPSVDDAEKIKQEIAERSDKIESLLETIKSVE